MPDRWDTAEGQTHSFADGCDPPHVWPSPSVAIANGSCAVCLGGGVTFDIVLGRTGACSACGGTGSLDDMIANQCADVDCVDHHPPPEEPDG